MAWLTQTVAAARLGISPRTLARRIAAGKLATRKEGRLSFVEVETEPPDAVATMAEAGSQLAKVTTANAVQRSQDATMLAAMRQTLAAETQRVRWSARWAWVVATAALIAVAVGAIAFHQDTRRRDAETFALKSEKAGIERTADGLRNQLANAEGERNAAQAEAVAARKDADETFKVFANLLVGGDEAVASAKE